MTSTPTPSLRGRVVLITGATSGIGRATTLALAPLGPELVLLCRDRAKGEGTAAAARAAGAASVDLLHADLGVQSEVRRAAGVVDQHVQRTETADGIEATFAVNHLAYFLFTTLLLDRLRASAPARIVNVASEAHKFGTLDFDDLQNARRYRVMNVYGQSKLANILFTAELARRLEGSGVTANSLHPGAVATGLGTNNGAWSRALIRLLRPFFRTPDDGAATSVHLATSPAVEGVSGRYFAKCREKTPSRAARDMDAARRLWAVSEQMTSPSPQTASSAHSA